MKRFVVVVTIVALAASGLALAGKKDKDDDRIAALEAKIAQLEEQMQTQQAQLDGLLGDDSAIMGIIDEALAGREQRANAMFREISILVSNGDQLAAKQKMDEFQSKYAGTQAANQAARIGPELAVVGKAAPASVNVEKWFVGEGTSLDLNQGTTLVVFFEEWCPHCKREMPKLQETYEKLKGDGLQVIGLTKVTKSATDEKVATFCSSNNLAFPVIKENGDMSQYFNVSGIPAAAVVQNGQIVWRGHPGRLSEAMLQGFL